MISKNDLFLLFLCIFLFFGVVFYDVIGATFTYTDEILTIVLCFIAVLCFKKEQITKPTKELINIYILLAVFLFYLIYSIAIQSNTNSAILQDLIVQIKPFLGFIATIYIAPKLNNKHKTILKWMSVLCFIILAAVLAYSLTEVNIDEGLTKLIGHPSRFATSVTITAFIYLYSSKISTKNIFLFFIMLSLGFFTLKAKFYGFYIICLVTLSFYKKIELKLTFKTLLLIIPIITAVVYFSYDKLNYFFVVGSMQSDSPFARAALYDGALTLFQTYFPFGTGFASYGTFFSGVYYSKIYYELGFDKLWGLSPDFYAFISDTFYPAIAQFGLIGLFLFFRFFQKTIINANRLKTKTGELFIKEYTIIVLIVFFFIIESVADSTFSQNRGVFMMILMGMCLSDLKKMESEIENKQSINKND